MQTDHCSRDTVYATNKLDAFSVSTLIVLTVSPFHFSQFYDSFIRGFIDCPHENAKSLHISFPQTCLHLSLASTIQLRQTELLMKRALLAHLARHIYVELECMYVSFSLGVLTG